MRDLDKLIVAKGFKKLPKVQKIAQPGHTASFVSQYQKKVTERCNDDCDYDDQEKINNDDEGSRNKINLN